MRVLGGLELLREDFGNYSMQVSREKSRQDKTVLKY
jgi:hypothetical protein